MFRCWNSTLDFEANWLWGLWIKRSDTQYSERNQRKWLNGAINNEVKDDFLSMKNYVNAID